MNAASTVGRERLIVLHGNKIRLRRTYWLWKPFLAYGELSVWAGLPDMGKGSVAAYATAQITSGQPFPDGSIADRNEVLILTGEETPATTTLPRILAAGGNLEKVGIATGVGRSLDEKSTASERLIALQRDVEKIEEYLRENPSVSLVVIDPVDVYFAGAKKNSTENVSEIYGKLKRLAENCNVAVLLVDHLNKNGSQAAIHRVGGAGAAAARPRLVWLFARDKENPAVRHISILKGNILAESDKIGRKFDFFSVPLEIEGKETSQPVIHWLGESNETADSLLSETKSSLGAPSDKRLAAEEFLRKELAEGERLSAEIYEAAKRAGIDTSKGGTLDRAKEALKLKSFRKEVPGRWYLPAIVTPVRFDPARLSVVDRNE